MNSKSSDKGISSSTADEERAVNNDNLARHAVLLDRENEQQQQQQRQRNFRRDNNNRSTNDTSSSSSSSSLFTRYLKLMERQPLLTKSVTSAVIGALGAALGSYLALSTKNPTATRSRSSRQQRIVDWLDIFSFAIYGGFVGGPLGHYWDEWLKEHGPASRSKAMLLDQLLAQPPRLLLMYLVLDVTRAALRELPASWNRSCSNQVLSPAVALSWRVWPMASYLVLAMCNNNKGKRQQRRRPYYSIAIHTCALLFVTELARRRVALRQGST